MILNRTEMTHLKPEPLSSLILGASWLAFGACKAEHIFLWENQWSLWHATLQ